MHSARPSSFNECRINSYRVDQSKRYQCSFVHVRGSEFTSVMVESAHLRFWQRQQQQQQQLTTCCIWARAPGGVRTCPRTLITAQLTQLRHVIACQRSDVTSTLPELYRKWRNSWGRIGPYRYVRKTALLHTCKLLSVSDNCLCSKTTCLLCCPAYAVKTRYVRVLVSFHTVRVIRQFLPCCNT